MLQCIKTPHLKGIGKMASPRVTKSDPPKGASAERYKNAALLDSYAVFLPEKSIVDARQLAELTLGDQSPVAQALMSMRDKIMGKLGVLTSEQMRDTSVGDKINYFPVVAESRSEIELGMNDRHLDFRVWFTLDETSQGLRARSTTVVRTHNLLGRAYITIIRPFHVRIVRGALRRAATRLAHSAPRENRKP